MTNEEAKSCIDTIKMLRRSAYNMYGVIDVIDSDNCEKIIKVLSDIPKYKDAYGKGWDDGAKASYEHLKMCEEEQEQSGDLISRDELLKAIDTWDKFGVDDTNSLFRLDNLSLPYYVPYIHYDDVIKCIKGMTSVNLQEPKYCDRNICIKNEYNGISCDECEVIKSQSQESEKINCKATKCENCQNHNYCDYEPQKRSEKE